MDETTHSEIEEIEETDDSPCCESCGDSSAALNEELSSVTVIIGFYPIRQETRELCESCRDKVGECYDCNRTFDPDMLTYVDGEDRCESCLENYYRCEDCGDLVHCDYTYNTEDATYCQECGPSHDRDEAENESGLDYRIHNYNYRPDLQFFGKGKLFFGCELEINYEDCEEAVDWVLDTLGEDHVYLKEDGSLDNGFEIVSHPHSFEESLKLWGKMSQKSPMTSHKSGQCGFHVHVSRAALTPLQIQKMVVFVNAPENAGLVDKVAQRTGNGYCRKKDAQIGHCAASDSRYEAINLLNGATIEFRIFKGNTRPERLMKNLEFVHALIHWVNLVSYRQLTSALFREYVGRHKKIYPNLSAFLYTEEKKEENS